MRRRIHLFTALLAVLAWLTVGGPADASAAPVKKKGVSAWNFTDVTKALADAKVGWFFTWASDRQQIRPPAGVEFVPMIWGAASVTDAQLATARKEGTTLLGFNEPDLPAQADMSVTRALDLWPRLQSTGMRLGAPAVAGGGDRAGGWLDQFMRGAAARHYKVDFIPLHWYGSDFRADAATGQLRSYLQAAYNRYRKPIWLTEYALIDFSTGTPRYPTPEQQAAFVTKSAAMLQGLPFVERYAWFTLSADRGGTGLYNRATPNRVGAAYRAAG